MNKILEKISGGIMLVGILTMGIGIIGSIFLHLNLINISSNMVMLAPAGFGITFVGGILSMVVTKDKEGKD